MHERIEMDDDTETEDRCEMQSKTRNERMTLEEQSEDSQEKTNFS
jgi:hypothetical protein